MPAQTGQNDASALASAAARLAAERQSRAGSSGAPPASVMARLALERAQRAQQRGDPAAAELVQRYNAIAEREARNRMTAGEVAEDVRDQAIYGAARGVAGIGGFAAEGGNHLIRGVNYLTGAGIPEIPFDGPRAIKAADWLMGGGLVRDEPLPIPEPRTTAGRYAETVGEWAGGSVLPGGASMAALRTVPRSVALGVAGGATARFAEDQAAGTGWEGVVGPVVGLGTMLAGGKAWGSLRTTPGEMIARRTRNITPEQWAVGAERLAESYRTGVPLMGPEALDSRTLQATAGDVMASRAGEPMHRFLDARPGQVRTVATEQMDRVAPAVTDAATVARNVREGAEAAVRQATAARTAAAHPYYRAAELEPVPSMADLAALRRGLDAEIARVGAGNPVGQELLRYRNSLFETRYDPTTGTATRTGDLEPRIGPLAGEYQATRDAIALSRRNPADPKAIPARVAGAVGEQNAALGRILERNPNFGRAQAEFTAASPRVDALLDSEVGQMLSAGSAKMMVDLLMNPGEARSGSILRLGAELGRTPEGRTGFQGLARLYLENALEASAKRPTGGENRLVGVNLYNRLVGPQAGTQAANIQTLLKEVARQQGLPENELWGHWNRVLMIMERHGRIPGVGSPSAQRAETYREAGEGGAMGAVASAADPAGGSLFGWFRRKRLEWSMGRNLGELATVFTSPNSVALMRELAHANPGSHRAALLTAMLFNVGRELPQAWLTEASQ